MLSSQALDNAFIMEEDAKLAQGVWPSAKPALQFSAVAMGCRLRQEIMAGWEGVQGTHSEYKVCS